jgi:uncharacterized membrane protein YgdD (TMEM256/DUF423 family)
MARSAYALTALASCAGAAGVIEAAIAAHGHGQPLLFTSAHFLLINAAASIALNAFGMNAPSGRCWFLAAAVVLLAGGLLFSADLSVRALAGHRLFPFAAPIGGTLMIAGWVMAALSALCCVIGSRRRDPGSQGERDTRER